MQKHILNYRIIIEPEKMGKKTVYNAYCSTLGLADFGNSVDEAIQRIQSLIKFHIESLLKDGLDVPKENTIREIITSTQVLISRENNDYHVAVG